MQNQTKKTTPDTKLPANFVQELDKITKDNLRFPNIVEENTNMLHDDFRTEKKLFRLS